MITLNKIINKYNEYINCQNIHNYPRIINLYIDKMIIFIFIQYLRFKSLYIKYYVVKNIVNHVHIFRDKTAYRYL